MTKEDWKKVQGAWATHKPIKLEIDGYKVSLQTQINRKSMEVAMMTFVDGLFKMEWVNGTPDGRAIKFYQRREKSFRSRKEIKQAEKAMGKRWCKKHGIYAKHIYYMPYWKSFNSFKKHILANNEDIKLLEA